MANFQDPGTGTDPPAARSPEPEPDPPGLTTEECV